MEHDHTREQLRQVEEMLSLGKGKEEEIEIPKRAASTPLEEGKYSQNYTTFGLSGIKKKYSCENCQRRHEPPLCGCPNCGRPHLVSKCPFSGISEGETS